ncbi:hypothetical protein I656_02596 [Geobacillus sp. WSUCF1]|nr:hypothetical protein I656_02596 [Geobacillus sp. WSUCF1]
MLLQEVDGTSLKVGKEKRAGGALFLCACGKEGGECMAKRCDRRD